MPSGRPNASRAKGGRPNPQTAKAVSAMRRRPRMSGNLKLTLAVVAVALAILGTAVVFSNGGGGQPADAAARAEMVLRPDSHRLGTAADGKVTLVEFLDFECEVCGAAFPGVERLREEYAGKITYAARYFPIESHANATNAALAAQAAADQGKFEDMYLKLFQNQKLWGEKRDSQAAVFEGYATEIGLDMARFRTDVAAPATAERVRRDQEDGIALGVQGTPTFFLNGERFEGEPTYEGLKAAVDEALNR